jgi:hypothetical protein
VAVGSGGLEEIGCNEVFFERDGLHELLRCRGLIADSSARLAG